MSKAGSNCAQCDPFDCRGELEALRRGDRTAGERLLTKYRSLVGAIVARILGPDAKSEWEDTCQTVSMRLWMNLLRWQGECPLCKFVAIIAARATIDVKRSQGHSPLVLDALDVPGRDELGVDFLDCVEHEIQKLPPRWAEMLRMLEAGVSKEEIADKLGVSVRAIGYWKGNAYERLRRCLE